MTEAMSIERISMECPTLAMHPVTLAMHSVTLAMHPVTLAMHSVTLAMHSVTLAMQGLPENYSHTDRTANPENRRDAEDAKELRFLPALRW
jgi:hypothetical protein